MLRLAVWFPIGRGRAGRTHASARRPQTDTSFIDAQGTAHITRVVPVPDTVSPEAQKVVAAGMPDTKQSRRPRQGPRTGLRPGRSTAASRCARPTRSTSAEDKIAGVPMRIVTPLTIPARQEEPRTDQPSRRRLQRRLGIGDRDRFRSPISRKPRWSRSCTRWLPSIHFPPR